MEVWEGVWFIWTGSGQPIFANGFRLNHGFWGYLHPKTAQ